MSDIFPPPITRLPVADVPLRGVTAHLSQASDHQILFMEFAEDVELPEHQHDGQWGIVVDGRTELTIDGVKKTFQRGDRYYIPAGVRHSAKIFAGYADVTFFDQRDRYRPKV